MGRLLRYSEYKKFPATTSELSTLREGAELLHGQLRPTIRQFNVNGRKASFRNVIGSFSLPNGDIVEVAPKLRDENWVPAVMHLLSFNTRLAVTGSQRSSASEPRTDLTGAVALEFARRLERALRRDGPIVIYERRQESSRRWRGRLEVSGWSRSNAVDPVRFPMAYDELTIVNDFTRALSIVAGLLSRSAARNEVAAQLRRLQSSIVPGSAIPAFVNPAIALRRIPAQWRSYAPAWEIAAPILRNRSVIGAPGQTRGLEVAVEPWRLLETLLERALVALAVKDPSFRFVPKSTWTLLEPRDGDEGSTLKPFPTSVEPDGTLEDHDGRVIATFEAKYSSKPKREHVYQALTTAAARQSPLAFLIYPWQESPRLFDVCGFNGTPRSVISVGVGLFGYRGTESDSSLAATISPLLRASQIVQA